MKLSYSRASAREACEAETHTWKKMETYRRQKIWLYRQRTPAHPPVHSPGVVKGLPDIDVAFRFWRKINQRSKNPTTKCSEINF